MSRLHVHVHLDAGRSPESWNRLVEERRVWDDDPYGYSALSSFCRLTHSSDVEERRPLSLVRRGAKKVLGLDLLHAWRDRRALREADYVVTHTEHEFLAVLLLLRLFGDRRFKTICQGVWLWDRWSRLGRVRRWFYLTLMERAAVLTVLSPENRTIAIGAQLSRPVTFVPFGVRPLPALALDPTSRTSIRVVSAGNDRDRDWELLAVAVRLLGCEEVRIRSRRPAARRAFKGYRAHIGPSASIDEFWSDLEWSDVVVVPLRHNLHASGVTVVLEAVSAGRPVVVADVGGLREYFGDKVTYYRTGDVESLVNAIRRAVVAGPLAEPGDGAESFVVERGLRSVDYAHRHMLLIEALRNGTPIGNEVSAFMPPQLSGLELQ